MNVRPSIPFDKTLPTKSILGVSVLSVGWDKAVDFLAQRIRDRRYTPVGFLNAHNANVAWSDTDFRQALNHFLILPDGVGVDLAAKWQYGSPFPANLNGTDFIPALICSIKTPMTVALLGATRENAGGAAEQLSVLAPQHRYEVIHDGYFKAHEEPAILERLRQVRPDMLLVAMGVPRQEFWIESNLTGEHCTMPVAVGALLDFLSGHVPRAPLWLRRLRLEWLYRLWIEPGRLWRRYIIGNPLFIGRVLASRFTGLRAKASS